MAHALDNSKGKVAFIAYQEPGWHGLGKVKKDGYISAEEALVDGQLDFTVVKLPNIHLLPNGKEIISKTSFFNLRTDTNAILADRLGRDYTVVQNVEAINVVDEIVQSGTAIIETAGALDGGKKVFICMKVTKSIEVGAGDKVDQYVLFVIPHDGSMSVIATPTNVRVVCANTMAAALRGATGAIRIRHTSNAVERLAEAAKVLNLIHHNTLVNTDTYNAMRQYTMTPEMMFNYFGNIFCTEEEIGMLRAGKQAAEVLKSHRVSQLTDVLAYANKGIGQAEAMDSHGMNMWFAYNAVTGYMTAKPYKSVNDRAKSLMFGTGAELITKAGLLAQAPEKMIDLKRVDFISNINLN